MRVLPITVIHAKMELMTILTISKDGTTGGK